MRRRVFVLWCALLVNEAFFARPTSCRIHRPIGLVSRECLFMLHRDPRPTQGMQPARRYRVQRIVPFT